MSTEQAADWLRLLSVVLIWAFGLFVLVALVVSSTYNWWKSR